ncbi:putative aldouronate transport system substrate-binding protein [Paenibacillus endophyticus]|uniref:Putative aldouronate transport system substrate-binding protein n=1 Tax=Paenibacillus endophyticus TaxID=1294268 RepID=A0A7W5CDQ5_9BACL|nr:extracellular solute-binding protein [Paenibacillus endophyticus]MBB3155795.1 putative aldouronate transport system substrate-binding protein [Paenibacillus endophyticus]
MNYRKQKVFTMVSAVTLSIALLAGCSTNNANQTTNNGGNNSVSTETNTPIDPMAKFDPPIELTVGVAIGDAMADDFTEEKWENSVWIKAYRDELGIIIKPLWYTKGTDAGKQKMSVAIASGDIPDLIGVSTEQLATLSRTNLYTDLSEVYENYATSLTKGIITEEGNSALESATFGGKLIAIPGTNSAIDGASFLWARQDWLDKLGLPAPKTTDELYTAIKAVVEQDPDGNGKDDTVGLMLNKDFLSPGLAEAIGLFNAFDAYPKTWVRGEDGKLVYGSALPEVKDALSYLNKLYTEGLIEKDFAAKDSNKAAELAAAGRVGFNIGAMWNGMFPLQQTKDNFPDSNWLANPIVSKDDQPANPQIKLNVENYYVMRSGYEHPEAIMKLINFWTELNYGDTPQEEYDKFLGPAPAPGHHWTVAKAWKAQKNLQAHLKLKEAFKAGDTSKLNAEEKGYYDNIQKYKDGDNANAQFEKVFGETGSFKSMNEYVTNNLFKMDEFYGASTDVMKNRLKTIEQAVIEYYTKVIMGSDSVNNFEKFVSQLNQLGLEEVTKEVNDWDAAK